MNTQFQDLEDERNRRNGQTIDGSADALALLKELSGSRPPFMCQFIGSNGYNLIVGIGVEYGCIQYSSNDGMPPFLMAVEAHGSSSGRDMEFLVGGTPTPIDAKYRLAMHAVVEAVAEFAATGKKTSSLHWVDLDGQ